MGRKKLISMFVCFCQFITCIDRLCFSPEMVGMHKDQTLKKVMKISDGKNRLDVNYIIEMLHIKMSSLILPII